MTGSMTFDADGLRVAGRTIRAAGPVRCVARFTARYPPAVALSGFPVDDPRTRSFERLPTPGPRPVAENPRSDAVKRRAAVISERLHPTTGQAPPGDVNFPLRRDVARASLGLAKPPLPQGAREVAEKLWGKRGAAQKGF